MGSAEVPVAVETTLAVTAPVLCSDRQTHTHIQTDTRSSLIAKCCVLPYQCPVYDLDNNVAFIGMYQTMTKTAAITVQVEYTHTHTLERSGN